VSERKQIRSLTKQQRKNIGRFMQQTVTEVQTQNEAFWRGAQQVCFNQLDFDRLMQSEMSSSGPNGTLAKAFFAALLLTQSPQRAETAVLEAIGSLNTDEPFEKTIIRRTVHTALNLSSEIFVSLKEWEAAFAALPAELQAVLSLPPNLRRCFVLRILLQLPGESCAWTLRLHKSEIDQYTCEALWSLPAYQSQASYPSR
jgi:hypothetical protein